MKELITAVREGRLDDIPALLTPWTGPNADWHWSS